MQLTGKRIYLGFIGVVVALLVVSIAFIGGCTGESGTGEPEIPVPPTEPVTPGYIQSYDHQLGYDFEYPEDWEMQVLECNPPIEAVMKFTRNKEEPTRIEISIKSTNLKSLTEVKAFGYIDRNSILEEKFVDINDRKAYEVVFTQYPDKKAKWVIFLANDREYMVRYHTTEELFAASEEVFDHVINSFFIE